MKMQLALFHLSVVVPLMMVGNTLIARQQPLVVASSKGKDLDVAAEASIVDAINNLVTQKGWGAVVRLQLIGWSCKCQDDDGIPNLIDDVVLLVKWNGEPRTWGLVSLQRVRGSDRLANWVENMRWNLNDCSGAVPSVEVFTALPDSEKVGAFIQNSNFGYNELFNRKYKTLAVYSYWPDQKVHEIVVAGVNETERQRRRDLFMEMNASPADK